MNHWGRRVKVCLVRDTQYLTSGQWVIAPLEAVSDALGQHGVDELLALLSSLVQSGQCVFDLLRPGCLLPEVEEMLTVED